MKQTLKTFNLTFTAPLHISDARLDYGSSGRMIHSDTIYAAVIAALARTGNLPEKVEQSGDLGCTISSLFPFTVVEGQLICFFPRPFISVNQDDENIGLAKKMKKVKWLDQPYFEAVINRQEKSIGDEEKNMISGEFLSEYDLKDHTIMFTQTVPRAKIPRSKAEDEGETTIFYMERILFSEGSGLYLIVDGDTSLLEKGLHILQYEGIGTDRSIGQGTFTLLPGENIDLKIPETDQYVTTLGLLCTEEKDVNKLIEAENGSSAKRARWDLIHRGGWLTTEGYNGIRKKSVYMFTEGSVFYTGKPGIQISGMVNCNIKPDDTEGLQLPDHPVWRCGRTIAIPVQI
ncbi:MAG: type III-A CRISPR-associated RAMP protein Csm4 [Bacteroidales bacterium]|nr:type III-A CRISPR-associated RAMP protein Csm4 [Bacteroidales bacterium]